jgi:hypothetical protein
VIKAQMNGEESIKDLAAAMDETLNKIKTHFEATSSEILSKSILNKLTLVEQLSARMENMEKTVTEMMDAEPNADDTYDQPEEEINS